MKFSDCYSEIIRVLEDLYDLSERNNIARYYMEDVFAIKNVLSEHLLSEAQIETFKKDLEKLKSKMPLVYITNKSFFYGLEFYVNKGVLIPRPETEELVDWVVRDQKKSEGHLKILDIGTGSGCIACSIKKSIPSAEVTAIDCSLDALVICAKNAQSLDVEIKVEHVDFLDITDASFLLDYDIIISNPPYIAHKEKELMNNNVLDHEPHLALFPDNDPLIFYKKISELILPGKHTVYLEINQYLAKETIEIFENRNMKTELRKDMQGKDRMLKVS